MIKVKLEDVAKRAKVSKTTVSRVLNNRGYLSQNTIDKVYEAIRELNYQPNIVARQLHRQKTNIIGLLFPTISNPFFGELVEELENRLYKRGYTVIVGNSMHNKEKESYYLNQLLTKQIDGLIVGTHNNGIQEYKYKNLPIVSIERTMNHDIPVVECDNYNGGALATNYLYQKGARYIVHVRGIDVNNMPATQRTLAYRNTMQTYKLCPREFVIPFDISLKEKKNQIRRLFKENPKVEGIFAGNDVEAALIIDVAESMGISIPKDLLVVGFDGTRLIRSIRSNLTTIVQPIGKMAEQAILTLESLISGQETPKMFIFPVTIHESVE